LEAAGIEPVGGFDETDNCDCGCDFCRGFRAARALHSWRPEWLELASLDADLQRLVAAWGALSKAMRAAVMALIGSIAAVIPVSAPRADKDDRD
jgi:hypothetical protein